MNNNDMMELAVDSLLIKNNEYAKKYQPSELLRLIKSANMRNKKFRELLLDYIQIF